MKINQVIEKINKTPILVLLIMIKDFKDLIMDLFSINTDHLTNIDWWDFIVKLIISVLLWLVLKAFLSLKRKFDILNVVFSIRNKHSYIKSFEGVQYYKTSFETDEQFFNRTPEGQYYQYLRDEYLFSKKTIIERFDLKPSEAEKELEKIYFIENEYHRNNEQVS